MQGERSVRSYPSFPEAAVADLASNELRSEEFSDTISCISKANPHFALVPFVLDSSYPPVLPRKHTV